jgi:2-hydroxychromene-2-carboxylate isomerase
MKSVDFYFDYGSPASYLAWAQLPALCHRYQVPLHYKPFVLGAVFKATGNSSPAAVPAKREYVMQDLARWAKKWDVTLHVNPHFPIDTIPLMKMAVGVQLRMMERFDLLNRSIFRALWVEARDLGDPDEVAGILRSAGFDPAVMQGLIAEPEVRESLRRNTTEAIERGAFGAPTFFVGDEMFWGQDRLHMLEETLAAQE